MGQYYTYAFLRKDRTPYYIGKGKGRRAYVKERRGAKPPSDPALILILKKGLTENEAIKHEIYMISVFGRKDLGTGILLNLTNGGEGCEPGPETRRKRSESMAKARSNPELKQKYKETYAKPEVKKRLSEAYREVQLRPEVREKQQEYYDDPEWSRKCSERNKGEKNPCYGKRWWVNELNETKYQKYCPGPEWQRGRIYKPLA
jgi:hypothetical protein